MIYIILVFILVLLDQISKYIVDKNFFEGDTIGVLTDLAIAYYLYKGRNKMSLLEKLGFTFVLAGAIGNMIDRIWRGFVIDMIDFRGIWSFVFNLADVWINIGVVLILLDYFFAEKKKKK